MSTPTERNVEPPKPMTPAAAVMTSVCPIALGIGGFSVVLAGVAWTLVQRAGDPTPARAAAALGPGSAR